ncbi:MAG: formate dehydrogenase accessory protein FdhE [Desulfobacteraceae bacterium]|nr:formate dehydrogenase accessory protein FdhE [Desulfobacteraceae bacterium]
MNSGSYVEEDQIERAIALSRVERPAYSHLYGFLEALFTSRAAIRDRLSIKPPIMENGTVATRWENGFPLLNRWDFPIDTAAAGLIVERSETDIPPDNRQLRYALEVLQNSLRAHAESAAEFWQSFLHHEMEPWEEWIEPTQDTASVLFLARNALRPSIERTASLLLEKHPIPGTWLKGYCPVCGSLPSILYLEGAGARKALCSWCGTTWDLHRLQCPYCENRHHESLGYLALEDESRNRVVYCDSCKHYFKQIDTRELAYPPYWPLEEWTTLHLDLLAQKAGWLQPPSPSPAIYGTGHP